MKEQIEEETSNLRRGYLWQAHTEIEILRKLLKHC